MGNFNPTNLQFRSAWEETEGVPTHVNPAGTPKVWLDQRLATENLAFESPLIQPNVLNPNRQRVEGLPAKFDTTGDFNTDLEPEGMAPWLAQFQGWGNNPVVLTAGQSFRHVLAPSATDVNFNLKRSARVWRDDDLAQLLIGCQLAQSQITGTVNNVYTATQNLLFERAHYWDFATVVTEGGTPERPVLRNIPTYGNWNLADHDIYVQVQTTTTNIKVKVGAATTYTGADIAVPNGGWVTLTDQSDNPIGEPDSPVQLYVGTTAAWTANDEWRFRGSVIRGDNLWTPSFPVLRALNEIHTTIRIDGGEVRFRQGQITLNQTVNPRLNLGGRYADGTDVTGQRVITGSLDRRYIDTNFVKRLEASQGFEYDLEVISRQTIGTSSDIYRMRFFSPKARISGRRPVVSGPNDFPESLSIDFYPDATNPTYQDDMTIEIDNGLASLIA